MDTRSFRKNQFSSPQLPPPSSWKILDYLPFIQPIVASQCPLSPPPSSPWSPPGRGTTTRTWTSSPTETRALLPSSQVKTENLNFHKLNLEIIVKAYKTDNTLSLVTQGPNRQSTTPTSCTPSTTRSTHSCTRPRPRNEDMKSTHQNIVYIILLFKSFSVQCDVPQNVLFLSVK